AAGALLTTAVALAVAHRRRRRDHTAGRDRTVPAPEPAAAALHTAVLAAATTTGTARIDAALRTLAALHSTRPAGSGAPVPQVLLVRPDQTIDVYLREPVPDPPAPWTANANGRIWVLPPDADLPAPTDMPPPCPTLVQLGLATDRAEL
nr:hypothetical protein [Micromonospora sp. DSM 115978]